MKRTQLPDHIKSIPLTKLDYVMFSINLLLVISFIACILTSLK